MQVAEGDTAARGKGRSMPRTVGLCSCRGVAGFVQTGGRGWHTIL